MAFEWHCPDTIGELLHEQHQADRREIYWTPIAWLIVGAAAWIVALWRLADVIRRIAGGG